MCSTEQEVNVICDQELTLQGSHGIEKPGKSREFVLVFFPGLEVWNFVEKPGIFT